MSTDKLLLGQSSSMGNVYLSKHSWDCGWYWSLGYIGNSRIHAHISSLINNDTDLVSEIFVKTKLNQDDWWVIRDLFIQAYALKNAAEVYQHGGHQTSRKGVTDIIQNSERAAQLNADLKIVLDTVWDYIEKALKE